MWIFSQNSSLVNFQNLWPICIVCSQVQYGMVGIYLTQLAHTGPGSNLWPFCIHVLWPRCGRRQATSLAFISWWVVQLTSRLCIFTGETSVEGVSVTYCVLFDSIDITIPYSATQVISVHVNLTNLRRFKISPDIGKSLLIEDLNDDSFQQRSIGQQTISYSRIPIEQTSQETIKWKRSLLAERLHLAQFLLCDIVGLYV